MKKNDELDLEEKKGKNVAIITFLVTVVPILYYLVFIFDLN